MWKRLWHQSFWLDFFQCYVYGEDMQSNLVSADYNCNDLCITDRSGGQICDSDDIDNCRGQALRGTAPDLPKVEGLRDQRIRAAFHGYYAQGNVNRRGYDPNRRYIGMYTGRQCVLCSRWCDLIPAQFRAGAVG